MTITKDDVAQAVAELEADGISVSTKSVRKYIGTGSFTTIQTFLAELEEERHALIPAPDFVRAALIDTADLVWTRAVEQAARTHDAERHAFQTKADKAASDARERDEEIARLEEAQVAHEQVLDECQAKRERYRQKCQEQQRELSAVAARLSSAEDRAAMLERLLDRVDWSTRSGQRDGAADVSGEPFS